MRSYGSSLKTATSLPRTSSASPFRSSNVATPPVGLCGLFRKIARGDLSLARNRRTSSRFGRKSFDAFSSDSTTRALRRNTFGG